MKKVTWPTWKETWLTSVMVFIMVVLTMIFFTFIDTILNRGQMLLIGAWRPFG
jgi:preprotein translocase subunit SecE